MLGRKERDGGFGKVGIKPTITDTVQHYHLIDVCDDGSMEKFKKRYPTAGGIYTKRLARIATNRRNRDYPVTLVVAETNTEWDAMRGDNGLIGYRMETLELSPFPTLLILGCDVEDTRLRMPDQLKESAI